MFLAGLATLMSAKLPLLSSTTLFDCLSFSVMQICPASWENDWFWAFWALTRKAGVRLRLRWARLGASVCKRYCRGCSLGFYISQAFPTGAWLTWCPSQVPNSSPSSAHLKDKLTIVWCNQIYNFCPRYSTITGKLSFWVVKMTSDWFMVKNLLYHHESRHVKVDNMRFILPNFCLFDKTYFSLLWW